VVENKQIIEYLATRDNYNKLENLIAKELEEYYSMPKPKKAESGKKIKTLEEATEILSEAKHSVDDFLSLKPGYCNPKLELKGSLKYNGNGLFSTMVSNALFLAAGIGAAIYWHPMIGGAMVGVGISKLAFILNLNLSITTPVCNSSELITCIKGATREEMRMSLLHEYAHAVSIDRLGGQSLKYRCLSEGFAQGTQLHISKHYGAKNRSSLFSSIRCLDNARHDIKCKLSGKEKFFLKMEKNIKEEMISDNEYMFLTGAGYFLFRLAEEKHGEDIYKEVLEGNTKLLFA